MGDVYVKFRPGAVDRSECLGIAGTVDYDSDGVVVGVEVINAEEVTVDGRSVHTAAGETPGDRILGLPMTDNDAGASTIREYLCTLLAVSWDHDGFAKRPFGNSGWHFELFEPLVAAGLLPAEHEREAPDEPLDINWASVDTEAGRGMIRQAIEALSGYTAEQDEASRVVVDRG